MVTIDQNMSSDSLNSLRNSLAECYIREETHPLFSKTAMFEGFLDIPIITPPSKIIIPEDVVPFSKVVYKQVDPKLLSRSFICFYEADSAFQDFLRRPKHYFNVLSRAAGVISPDPSIYFDDPLVVNLIAIYMNHAVGHFLQENGFNVVANVRWGNEKTYDRSLYGEAPAFLGCPHHSCVAIGTHGAIKTVEKKEHFKKGLRRMLDELTPNDVLVYGTIPDEIFREFSKLTRFHAYTSWFSRVHNTKEVGNGNG